MSEGTVGDLDMLVPRVLTLGQVVRKVASVFNLRGLLSPILGSMRNKWN